MRGNFECTSVWSEAISSTLQSDQRWIWAQKSMIMESIRAQMQLRAYANLIKRQRSLGRPDQRSILSGTVKGHFSLDLDLGTEVVLSEQLERVFLCASSSALPEMHIKHCLNVNQIATSRISQTIFSAFDNFTMIWKIPDIIFMN